MPTKISANLERLTSQAQQNDRTNAASKPGFKSQERTIYIYEIRDFYGKHRAVFNELSNQIYLLTAHNRKEMKAYVLEEIRNNTNFSLSANVIGNSLEYNVKINTLLDTENRTYFISFQPIEPDTKMENIFYPTNITSKNTGHPEVDYEYNLASIGTILGENSSIKVFPIEKVGTIDSVEEINIIPREKWMCGGFDCNLDLRLQDIFPLWTKITKVSGNTFDYVNMWSNKNWLYDWDELLRKSDTDLVTGKPKVTISKLLSVGRKIFIPGVNLIKKLLQLNVTLIRHFEGFNRAGTINVVGQVPGEFWQNKIGGKSEAEVNKILSDYIITEMRHWRNGQYQGPIKENFPWGQITAIPVGEESLEYSERVRQQVLSIIFMLSSQIISPFSLAGGRTDFTFFALPYFLTFNENQIEINTNIGLYDIIGEELFVESAYISFSYPYFTEEQVKEFNETREVHGYSIITTNKNAGTEERYGPINPYLEVGDEIIIKNNIEKIVDFPTDNVNRKLLAGNGLVAIDREPLGFDGNPLILCFTDMPKSKKKWTYLDLPNFKIIPAAIIYSYSKWSVWGSDEINNFKTVPIREISWYDFLEAPGIILGVIYNAGAQPKAADYQRLENSDRGEESGKSFVEHFDEVETFINDKITEVRNDENKFFIGTPTISFNIAGYHYILALGPLTTYQFYPTSCTLRAVIATGNVEVYKKVAKQKNISLEALYRQIKESSFPKLKQLELENEGLKIDLIDQEMVIPPLGETLEAEEYTTYPQAVTGRNLTSTWIFLSTVKENPKEFLEVLTSQRQIPHSKVINEKYIFINKEPKRELTFLKLRGFYSSIAEMQLICNGRKKDIDINLILGNKTEESQTTTTIVFKIREGEI